MKLAIADPPYPPMLASGGRKNRASRWYGTGQRSVTDTPADFHPEAHLWDDHATHVALMEQLLDEYDGWAIATSLDTVSVYTPRPLAARTMIWHRPNAQPGAHRIRTTVEAVIVYPPQGRRSNVGVGMVSDLLVEPSPRGRFRGTKPPAWTAWVLSALSYDPSIDVVDDLFPGSGSVTRALA